MAMPGLPPPKPIPLKDRSTLVFVERAQLDVLSNRRIDALHNFDRTP